MKGQKLAAITYPTFPWAHPLRSADRQVFKAATSANAGYTPNCAERTALFKAVSEGVLLVDTIARQQQGGEKNTSSCRPAGDVCTIRHNL